MVINGNNFGLKLCRVRSFDFVIHDSMISDHIALLLVQLPLPYT